MKKLFKILGITVVVILILLIVLPIVFKGKLVEMAKQEINDSVNAKVTFGDFDLSLFSSFPDLTLSLEELKITGEGQFDGTPLLDVNEISFDLDVMTVISGDEIKINEVNVNQLNLNALVLEDGTANYDIAKPSDEVVSETNESSTPYKLLLDHYAVKNSSIVYDNKSLDMFLKITELNHSGSGDISDQLYALKTKTTAATVDVIYEKINYLVNAEAEINADFDITDNFSHFALKENDVRLNNLFLTAEGSVDKPKDGLEFDLKYNATKTDLKNILSLIPKEYMADLAGLKTKGSIKLDGTVFGTYDDVNLPGFSINLGIDQGQIQYPDLPESMDNIATKTDIIFPGGADFDAMTVDVQNFNMSVAGSPINAKLFLKNPLTDPNIDASVDAQVNLADLKNAIELESVHNLAGIITADVDMKGRMSHIEKEEYEKFIAKGKVILQNMTMKSDSMPDVTIDMASLDFSPQKLALNNFKAKMGRSDFDAKGQINNYLAYFLKDETIKGSFNLNSRKIDLNEFLTEDPAAVAIEKDENSKSAPMEMLEIPKNVDFDIQATIGELNYDKIKMSQIKGLIAIKDGDADLTNVTMKVLGGNVKMNGLYSTKSGLPEVDFQYDVKSMDVKSTATTFNTMEKFAPLVSKCTGNFSSIMKVKMGMDKNMNPTFTSIQGDGDLRSQKIFIEGFEPLNKLADKLKISELAKQNINNVNFTFELVDGKVFVKPFDVKLDGIESNIGGTTAITGEIDYIIKMKVPVSKLGSNVNSYLSGLVGNINNLGLNLSVGQFVNMDLKVTGTMTDPKIGVSVVGAEGESVKDQIVNTVKDEINEAKDQAVDDAKIRARAEADKIIADAQKRADALNAEAQRLADNVRKEGKAAGQKLISQANNPIAKIAAKKAAEKLEKTANQKADKIVSEAKKRSDKVIADAKIKADQKLK